MESVSNKIIGTLTDADIIELIQQGDLIDNNYDFNNIKQACYELRASNIYYLPDKSRRKNILSDGQYILLKPNAIVVIITMESINLPASIIGRIMTKGILFSLGINAINTYVDPGFRGRLGIVFQNKSNNYLKINIGERIAKIEFSMLHSEVKKTYNGQHGYESEIWPYKEDCILTKEEIKNNKMIKSDVEEISEIYGNRMGKVFKNVLILQKRMLASIILYFIFNFIIFGIIIYKNESIEKVISPLLEVIIGIATSLIYSVLSFFFKSKE